MVKRALFEYIGSFNWKNIVEIGRSENSFSFWWMITYFLILCPFNTRLFHETVFAIVSYYLWALPFVIGVLGIQLFPLRLKKIVFLCPMNIQERRKYSYYIFWERILIPVIIEMGTGIVLCAFGVMKPIVVFIYAFSLLTFFIMVSVKVYGSGKPKEKASEQPKSNVKYFLCILFCAIVQMCNIMFMEATINGESIYRYILLGEMVIFFLIDIYCMRALPSFIEENIAYEESYHITEQQSKQKG